MVGLRAIRFIVFVFWFAIFAFGVLSAVQTEWPNVGLAALGWILVGVVFAIVNNAVESSERDRTAVLLDDLPMLIAMGDWAAALARTEHANNLTRTSVKATGSASGMLGPRVSTLMLHSLMLGANGRVTEALTAADAGAKLLSRVKNPTNTAQDLQATIADLQQGLQLRAGSTADVVAYCRSMASADL